MSERMTSVRGPGVTGIADSGRRTRAEMIAHFRKFYGQQLEEAERALAFADDDLIVETYLGPWAMKDRREVTS